MQQKKIENKLKRGKEREREREGVPMYKVQRHLYTLLLTLTYIKLV